MPRCLGVARRSHLRSPVPFESSPYKACISTSPVSYTFRTEPLKVGPTRSCLENPADVRELIPEFFSGDGAFLTNRWPSGLER
mmetsp:Transcript_6848/g.21428  ORF Transcript_6848/g.21428 Transcript_6848/m.21428 type:complete len:83 (-) Transcript_6848:46-294(-)